MVFEWAVGISLTLLPNRYGTSPHNFLVFFDDFIPITAATLSMAKSMGFLSVNFRNFYTFCDGFMGITISLTISSTSSALTGL